MDFIEIQPGISINAEKIDGVEEVDKNSCNVYVGSQTYLCKLPYSSFLDLLKNKSVVRGGKAQDTEGLLQKVESVLSKSEYFAG